MSVKTTAADIARHYDQTYGAIRRWVARNPGATAWLGVAGTVGGFVLGAVIF